MARVKVRELYWSASPSPDVTGHRVFYTQGRDTPVDLATSKFVDVGTDTSANISVVLDGEQEGLFSFWVAPLDDAGNEGDLYQHQSWVNVPLDLIPPGPVSGGGIRDFSS